MHTDSTDVWFCLPQCGLLCIFRAQNKVERLSRVDSAISREGTDLYPSRSVKDTHPVAQLANFGLRKQLR